jgi:probable biosynthetic protein (TIGR04098 family)
MADTVVELEVKEIIARLSRIGIEQIDTSRKATSYGIDSLGQLEFRELLERRFQTYLDDRTFTNFNSIDELIAYLVARQQRRSSNGVTEKTPAPNGSTDLVRKSRLSPSGVLFEDVEIGMSLTCLNNLAESPLLKYLGDLRWRHLSALSGVPSKLFADDNGRRLYPSFFYVEMSFPQDNPMATFGENDTLKIASTLKRFGGSMLDGLSFLLPASYPEAQELPFGSVDEALAAGVPAVRLSNIFVEQHNGSEWLRTARPSNPGFKTIPELAVAPEPYVLIKQIEKDNCLPRPGNSYVAMTDGPVRVEYPLVIDRDFSSTGLVYFANYPIFMDICEREVLRAAKLQLTQAMIDRRTIIRRQSFYLNNASPNETLIIEVEPWLENPVLAQHSAPEAAPIRLFINYRMYRKSDSRLMMVSTAEKLIFGVPFQELSFSAELRSLQV